MPNRNQYGAPKLVYRIDARSPEEVFRNGFSPWGSNLNFFGHILGDTLGHEAEPSLRSGLISATDSPDSALRFFGERLHVPTPAFYLYEIRATNNFYSAQRTASFYEQRIATNQMDVTHGSFDEACSAIELLRTAFAYQREWFSVGAIPANQIRGAWRVDTVPINPLHIRHQTDVHFTPRINEPEIRNSGYQDDNTFANHLPYTQGATLETRSTVSVPDVANDTDAGGGVEASLGFACFFPDSPHRSGRDLSKLQLSCYYAQGYPLKRNLKTNKLDHTLSQTFYSKVFLMTEKGKSTFTLGVAQNKPSINTPILTNDTNNSTLNFIYDSFLCLNWSPSDKQYSYALAPVSTGVVDLYDLAYSVATTNDESQKWTFNLQGYDVNKSYYRIQNVFLKSFSLFKHKTTNQLALRPFNKTYDDYEELFLVVGPNFSNDFMLLPQNPATRLVDLKMSWLVDNTSYIPVPQTNTAKASHGQQNTFFFDLISKKILYIDPSGKIFGLYNKRDPRYFSWDWINWTPTNLQKTTDKRLMWYFNNQKWIVFDDLNYRNFMSYFNNDYLWVVTEGINFGRIYTSFSKNNFRSNALFRIDPTAEV